MRNRFRRTLLADIADLHAARVQLAHDLDVEKAALSMSTDRVLELRAEVADLRRQNLALAAQLDHMTRVNQTYDNGPITVPTGGPDA